MKRFAILVAVSLLAGTCLAASAEDSCQLVNYKVKSGDTLSEIAGKYLDNPKLWKELLKYNNISDPNLIYPGDVIRIPSSDVLQKMSTAKDDDAARQIAQENEQKRKALNFKFRENAGDGSHGTVDIYAGSSSGRSGDGKPGSAVDPLKVSELKARLSAPGNPIDEVTRDPMGFKIPAELYLK